MNRMIATAVAVLMGSVVAAQPPGRPPVEFIGEPAWTGQRLPFANAVRVGDVLFLSGQIGNRPDGTLPEGIEAQARQTMENIGGVLKEQGLGFADIVKCTVMLDNIADWPAFNRVYVTYFPNGRYPARSAFGADGLALRALVEVECLAHSKAAGQ